MPTAEREQEIRNRMIELRAAVKDGMRAGQVARGLCVCQNSPYWQECLNQIRTMDNASRELIALLFGSNGDLLK